MFHRVFLPQLGQTMEEGTIERWVKEEGEQVAKGDILYELTTDKATLEVEAFAEGVLRKILVGEGETVEVNTLVAVIGDPGEEIPQEFLDAQAARPAAPDVEVAAAGAEPAASIVQSVPGAAPQQAERSFASPRARKLARELRVPLRAVSGSGPQGRVIERDVREFAAQADEVPHTPTAREAAFAHEVSLVQVVEQVGGRRVREADVVAAASSGRPGLARAQGAGRRVELTPMRRTIAERMARSKQTVPHFYLVGEVQMARARELAREVTGESGKKVTLTAVLVRAIGQALRMHERVNARFDGEAVVLNKECNVGVAVAVDDGLFVPVIRTAERKPLPLIAEELRVLAAAAREGRLLPEQYEGGSVTVSNLGMFGVDCFLPIINPPESCIVGVGAVKEQAIVVDGGIRIEPVMQMSISADHRAIDGVAAAEFFRSVKETLEAPQTLRG